MADAVQENGRLGESEALKFAGKIMVVFLVAFFFIVVLIFCAHLYARRFWYRRDDDTTTTARRRRLDFATARQDLRRGLDPAVLKTIPIIAFDPKDFKEGLECSVCLSEVCEAEKTRLLPKCNHGFHVECIDMWFESHSTCPLCRSTVANPTSEVVLQAPIVENPSVDVVPTEAPNLPTNVLFWGNETQVSTFGPCVEEGHREKSNSSMASTSSRPDGVASIDIPRRINEENELKSPVLTRLRSLKRLLSGNRRITSPSSPRNLDLEQGGRGQS